MIAFLCKISYILRSLLPLDVSPLLNSRLSYFLKSDLKKPFSFFFVLSVFSLVEAFSGSAVVVVAVVVVVTV